MATAGTQGILSNGSANVEDKPPLISIRDIDWFKPVRRLALPYYLYCLRLRRPVLILNLIHYKRSSEKSFQTTFALCRTLSIGQFRFRFFFTLRRPIRCEQRAGNVTLNSAQGPATTGLRSKMRGHDAAPKPNSAYRLRWRAFFCASYGACRFWLQRSRAGSRCRCNTTTPKINARSIILPLLAPTTAPIISTMATTETKGKAAAARSVCLRNTVCAITPSAMGNNTI